MKTRILLMVATVAMVAGTQGWAQNVADQVVARIGKAEITRAELRQEMPDGAGTPALESAALQAMVDRRLLADEALRQGLDRTPLGAMVLKRANELASIGMLQQKFAGTPPVVSDQQVTAFVTAHPTMFAQRRLVSLDQLLVDDSTPALLNRLKAANSMAEFEDVLLQERVTYRRSATVLDTVNIEPDGAAKIGALAPGQVFITPRGDRALELSSVSGNRSAPITGDAATRAARVLLGRTEMEQRVKAATDRIVKAGQSEVRINPQYAGKAT